MKKLTIFTISALTLLLSSCISLSHLNSQEMNKIELGMTKDVVTNILGPNYTIAEKRMEDKTKIEILSYRDFYRSDEFYMFEFKNDKLEKWHQVLQSKEKTN